MNTLKNIKPADIILTVLIAAVSIFLAYEARPYITGGVELQRWYSVLLSSKNVYFFAMLMIVAGFTGYVAHIAKDTKRKVMIYTIGSTLVVMVGYALTLSAQSKLS